MADAIDFYFDFGSPYGYFASVKIDDLAARQGRAVNWRVFLVGATMQVTGQVPIDQRSEVQQLYGWRDIERSARFHGAPLKLPPGFPYSLLAASRAYYWLYDQNPALAKSFAHAVYAAGFAEGRDLRRPQAVAEVAEPLGIDGPKLVATVEAPEWKQRFRAETDAALGRGVFGSPFFIVGEERFWGADRMAMLEWWLGSGG